MQVHKLCSTVVKQAVKSWSRDCSKNMTMSCMHPINMLFVLFEKANEQWRNWQFSNGQSSVMLLTQNWSYLAYKVYKISKYEHAEKKWN